MGLPGEVGFAGLAFERGLGGEVGVAEELADYQAATWLEDSLDLAQGCDRVGDLAEDGGEDHGVHRVVLEGESGGGALGGIDVGEAALGGSLADVVEELLLQIEDLDGALGADPLGHVEGVVANADADLENALAGLGPQHGAQAVSGDDRVRSFDPEALAIRARGRVLPPPQSSTDNSAPNQADGCPDSHCSGSA